MILCSAGDQAMDTYTRRFGSLGRQLIHSWLTRAQAYLEFFVNAKLLEFLLSEIETDNMISYYIINKQGDLRTNSLSEGPNAVTWGIFPGKEVVQPTIVEAISFMAWKVGHL